MALALCALAGLAQAPVQVPSVLTGNTRNPTMPQAAPARVVDRGQDHVTYQTILSHGGPGRSRIYSTNRFTLVENGLHYRDQGQWKESQDLLEPDPVGLRATHGPLRALLRPDLIGDATFELTGTNGSKLSGIVRQILATDSQSGESVLLGQPRDGVTPEFLPPNRMVFPDAFTGVRADLVYAYTHGSFRQTLVLREAPALPATWNPALVRLEVVTEFHSSVRPAVQGRSFKDGKGATVEDHGVVRFEAMDLIGGRSTQWVAGKGPTADRDSVGTPGTPGTPETLVRKQWIQDPSARSMLIESVDWPAVTAAFKGAARGGAVNPPRIKRGQLAPAVRSAQNRPVPQVPIRTASAPYEPDGLVVESALALPGTITHFRAGTTYYIRSNYYNGAPVRFDPGCVLKYRNAAYMLLYGPVTFPASLPRAVFTSRDDNAYGDVIAGVPGEPDSDGNPTDHRGRPLWFYYEPNGITVKNALIRWAATCLQYDGNPGVAATHRVQNVILEQSQIGLQNNLSSPGRVTFSNSKQCSLATVIAGNGQTSGTLTVDCGVVSTALVNQPALDCVAGEDPNKNSQTECSFVLAGPARIVAAFFDTHRSCYGLGQIPFSAIVAPRSTSWAVSTDGGVTFTPHKPLPPASPVSTWQGDAGDPSMVRDVVDGSIYVLVNPSREMASWKGFRLWKSRDQGQTFALINTNTFLSNGATGADKTSLAINNFPGLPNSRYLYLAGRTDSGFMVAQSADGGISWTVQPVGVDSGTGADIALTPDGTVYVFYLQETTPTGHGPYVNRIRYAWLRAGESAWNGPFTIPAHADSPDLRSQQPDASGDLMRSNQSTNRFDYFVSNAFPRVAVNPVTGRVYVVYTDLPTAGPSVDRGDIYIQEGTPAADGSLEGGWSGEIQVNNDATPTDQWNPSLAISADGQKIMVGYYSRQGRPGFNDLILPYAAKASIASGLVGATFDLIPVKTPGFRPVFPGLSDPENISAFDGVFCQGDVALTADRAVPFVSDDPGYFPRSEFGYQHFMADDYTNLAADSTYFYFTWCERSAPLVSRGAPNRPDPNVRFARIRQ